MVRDLGASAFKTNQAMESLAKTDDMLAFIGIIMLAGVIVSSYGAYWQGKYAKASYNNECTNGDTSLSADAAKHKRNVYIGIGIFIIVSGILLFVFKRKASKTAAAQ